MIELLEKAEGSRVIVTAIQPAAEPVDTREPGTERGQNRGGQFCIVCP